MESNCSDGVELGVSINSVPFMVYRWRSFPEIERCTSDLADEIDTQKPRKLKRSAKVRASFLSAVRLLVLNAYACHQVHRDLCFGVSVGISAFRSDGAYGRMGLSYRSFTEAYEGLESRGYLVTVAKGFKDPRTGHGENTKIRGTDGLISRLRYNLTSPLINLISDNEDRLLRFGRGVAPGTLVPDTDDTRQLIKNLKRINSMLVGCWADIYLTDQEFAGLNDRLLAKDEPSKAKALGINLSRRTLYRVFNRADLKQGGRFYGAWWQDVPQEYRRLITLNGKHTVEVDYSGIHPAILYAKLGLEAPEDPYDIGIAAKREAVKETFMVLLNAGKTIAAETKSSISAHGVPFEQIAENLVSTHKPIAKFFGTKAALWLQNDDARLAELVMLRFADLSRPCLPIHDSFIVHQGLEHDLIDAMNEGFVKLFNFNGRLKVKPRVLDNPPWKGAVDPASWDIDDILEGISGGEYAGYERRFQEGLRLSQQTSLKP